MIREIQKNQYMLIKQQEQANKNLDTLQSLRDDLRDTLIHQGEHGKRIEKIERFLREQNKLLKGGCYSELFAESATHLISLDAPHPMPPPRPQPEDDKRVCKQGEGC